MQLFKLVILGMGFDLYQGEGLQQINATPRAKLNASCKKRLFAIRLEITISANFGSRLGAKALSQGLKT